MLQSRPHPRERGHTMKSRATLYKIGSSYFIGRSRTSDPHGTKNAGTTCRRYIAAELRLARRLRTVVEITRHTFTDRKNYGTTKVYNQETIRSGGFIL